MMVVAEATAVVLHFLIYSNKKKMINGEFHRENVEIDTLA